MRGKSITGGDNLTELGSFDIENLPALMKGQPKIVVALVAVEDDLYLKVSDAQKQATLRLSSQQSAAVNNTPTDNIATQPAPMGGWLYLFALLVFSAPIWLTQYTYNIFTATFTESTWAELAQNITQFWAISQIISIAVFVMLTVLALYNCYLFIGKRRTFPRHYIWFMAFTLSALLADMLIIVPQEFWQEYWPIIINQSIACAIWIPYLLKSMRVKITFIK